VKTGAIISHQTYGDMLRFNPHWHCIILGRTKGKATKDGSLTKYGYTPTPQKASEHAANPEIETVSNMASRRSWARLIQKVYEVDHLIYEKCGCEMKVIAVIINPHDVRRILECLKRNKAPPFDEVAPKAS